MIVKEITAVKTMTIITEPTNLGVYIYIYGLLSLTKIKIKLK